jgi:energy-converting hydrogenase Eha subunit G
MIHENVMRHKSRPELKAANARLLLKLLRLEASVVAPLTALMIYLITYRADMAVGIGGAIGVAGLAAYAILRRHFTKSGVLMADVTPPER